MPSKRSKKGPTKGSGGKGRRALAGKKATLPAEKRHWYAEKQRIKAAERAQYLRRGRCASPQKSFPERPCAPGTGPSC